MLMEEALEAEGMKPNNAEPTLIAPADLNAIVSLRFAWKDKPPLCVTPHIHITYIPPVAPAYPV